MRGELSAASTRQEIYPASADLNTNTAVRSSKYSTQEVNRQRPRAEVVAGGHTGRCGNTNSGVRHTTPAKFPFHSNSSSESVAHSSSSPRSGRADSRMAAAVLKSAPSPSDSSSDHSASSSSAAPPVWLKRTQHMSEESPPRETNGTKTQTRRRQVCTHRCPCSARPVTHSLSPPSPTARR